ncbi:MAG: 4Fe-4S dicluster domain-containing protein [Actinobacteria bacterium]|nr:4Fe-4S dicluster domain-containing protein [Actinomycetota bacterium]
MKGIFRSLIIVIRNTFKRSVTVLYPNDRIMVPYNSRGSIQLMVDPDTRKILCDGCSQCEKSCPLKLISIEVDISNKKLKSFYIDISRCMFCGFCEEVCKKKALKMSFNYELTEKDLSALKYDIKKLTKHARPKLRKFWKT